MGRVVQSPTKGLQGTSRPPFSHGTYTCCIGTWRIIPVRYLATPIYKRFRPFGRGPTTLFRGLNHLLSGMILQVLRMLLALPCISRQTLSTVLCFASPHKHNHMDSLTLQEAGGTDLWHLLGCSPPHSSHHGLLHFL